MEWFLSEWFYRGAFFYCKIHYYCKYTLCLRKTIFISCLGYSMIPGKCTQVALAPYQVITAFLNVSVTVSGYEVFHNYRSEDFRVRGLRFTVSIKRFRYVTIQWMKTCFSTDFAETFLNGLYQR